MLHTVTENIWKERYLRQQEQTMLLEEELDKQHKHLKKLRSKHEDECKFLAK